MCPRAAAFMLTSCMLNHILAGRAETRSAASCICQALPCELLSRACDVRNGVWVVRVKVGVEWCVWAPGAVRGEVRCHDGEHLTPLVRYTWFVADRRGCRPFQSVVNQSKAGSGRPFHPVKSGEHHIPWQAVSSKSSNRENRFNRSVLHFFLGLRCALACLMH